MSQKIPKEPQTDPELKPLKKPNKKGGHYDVLGLDENATDRDIKLQKNKLSMEKHPDLLNNFQEMAQQCTSSEELQEYFDTEMAKINKSATILRDPKTRKKYDLYGEKGLLVKLENEGQLSQADFISALSMQQEKKRRLILTTSTQAASHQTVNVDATSFVALFRGLSGSSVQSFQAPISKNDIFQFQGKFDYGRNNQTNIENVLVWFHRFNDYTDGKWAILWVPHKLAVSEISLGRQLTLPYDKRKITTRVDWISTIYPHVTILGLNGYLQSNLSDNYRGVLQLGFQEQIRSCSFSVMSDERKVTIGTEQSGFGNESYVEFIYKQSIEDDEKFVDEHSEEEFEVHQDSTIDHHLKLGCSVDPMNPDGIVPTIDYSAVMSKNLSNETSIGIGIGAGNNGVHLDFMVERNHHNFKLPFYLSYDFNVKTFLLSSVITPVIYQCAKRFIFAPIRSRLKKREAIKKREMIYKKTENERRKQQDFLEQNKPIILQKKEEEMEKGGLVIMNARYGILDYQYDLKYPPFIDVTDALQYHVNDSQLTIHGQPFYLLKGFYDPCPKERKQLHIDYKFHGRNHEFTVNDSEPLDLPIEKDLMKQEEAKGVDDDSEYSESDED